MTNLGRIIMQEMGIDPIEAEDLVGDLSLEMEKDSFPDCSPLDIETDRILLTDMD